MTDLPRRAFSIALRELSPFSFIQSASAVSALSGLIRNSKILTHTMGAASARPRREKPAEQPTAGQECLIACGASSMEQTINRLDQAMNSLNKRKLGICRGC